MTDELLTQLCEELNEECCMLHTATDRKIPQHIPNISPSPDTAVCSTFLKKLFLTESTCSDESNSKLLDPRDRKPRVSRSRNQLDVPIVRGSSVLRKDLRLDLFIFPVLFVPKVKSINQIDL